MGWMSYSEDHGDGRASAGDEAALLEIAIEAAHAAAAELVPRFGRQMTGVQS
jgi:hypothetical protein